MLYGIKELDKIVEKHPELASHYPLYVKSRLFSYRNIVVFFIVYILLDIFFAVMTNLGFHYYMVAVFPLIVSLIPIALIILYFVRSLLVSVLEFMGLKEEGRIFLSLSLIFTMYEDFKDFVVKHFKYVFFPEKDGKVSIIAGSIIYLATNLGGMVPRVLETGDIHYLFYGKEFIFPWSVLGKIFVATSWILLTSVMFSIAYFVYRVLISIRALVREKEKFALFNTIEFLNDYRESMYKDSDLEDFDIYETIDESLNRGQYSLFYIISTQIVELFSKISLLILVVVIANVLGSWFLYSMGVFGITRVYSAIAVSIFAIALGLYFFIAPQMSFHALLKSFKESIVYTLKELYENMLFASIGDINKLMHSSTAPDLSIIKDAIEYNSSLKTWPYTIDQAIKIFGSIFILIESIAVQLITIVV